ncbi:MAG: phosphoglycerate kinase [Bacteroidales bacterium]|nr:phosphoglycerate kinase [Bacteroidales bacterium]MBR6067382.1 phosphoglycerate kinase [Bacteroidales bacterium]
MDNRLPLIQEADLKGKIVLVRVDHNVVKSGVIHDPYRIDATFGTLFYILSKGGKIILMTHVGRPKDKKTGKITIDAKTSVQPIVDYLENKLHIKIEVPDFYSHEDNGYLSIETNVNHSIRRLRNHDVDMIYLPNTRWFTGEEAKGEEQERFANQLAGLADIYVNDAFGSWQAHASTVGVTKYLPSYAGFLMQREIENLNRIFEAESPFVAVVAGSKFDTKIESLYALLKKADKLVLGGVIYNAYLCAKYGFKIKGVEEDDVKLAKEFVDYAKQYPGKIVEMPIICESDVFGERIEGKYRIHDIRKVAPGTEFNWIMDVDPRCYDEPEIIDVFHSAKTIFVNAVMGFVPHFNEGTIALDTIIDQNPQAVKLYGGGDTMQELKRLLPGLYIMALDSKDYYIFTGGGAVLKAIEQSSHLGIAPIKALIESRQKGNE